MEGGREPGVQAAGGGMFRPPCPPLLQCHWKVHVLESTWGFERCSRQTVIPKHFSLSITINIILLKITSGILVYKHL